MFGARASAGVRSNISAVKPMKGSWSIKKRAATAGIVICSRTSTSVRAREIGSDQKGTRATNFNQFISIPQEKIGSVIGS